MDTAFIFNGEAMKEHLTDRQCKRIIRLHKRLTKRIAAKNEEVSGVPKRKTISLKRSKK